MKTKAYKERKRKQKLTESEKEKVAKKEWSIFLKKNKYTTVGNGVKYLTDNYLPVY